MENKILLKYIGLILCLGLIVVGCYTLGAASLEYAEKRYNQTKYKLTRALTESALKAMKIGDETSFEEMQEMLVSCTYDLENKKAILQDIALLTSDPEWSANFAVEPVKTDKVKKR